MDDMVVFMAARSKCCCCHSKPLLVITVRSAGGMGVKSSHIIGLGCHDVTLVHEV